MNNITEVKIEIANQGDAVTGAVGYLAQVSDTMATFYVDGWGKTGRIYPLCTCDSVYFPETKTFKKYPTIAIEDGEENSDISEIYFPEFEGWNVFAVSGGKTMSVCLRKEETRDAV